MVHLITQSYVTTGVDWYAYVRSSQLCSHELLARRAKLFLFSPSMPQGGLGLYAAGAFRMTINSNGSILDCFSDSQSLTPNIRMQSIHTISMIVQSACQISMLISMIVQLACNQHAQGSSGVQMLQHSSQTKIM